MAFLQLYQSCIKFLKPLKKYFENLEPEPEFAPYNTFSSSGAISNIFFSGSQI